MARLQKVKDVLRRLAAYLPHIGMRKVKSVLVLFVGFWLWQGVRLVFPSLDVHPLFIYMYGLLEIRDSSEATADRGRPQIKTTFIALGVGLALVVASELIKGRLPLGWPQTAAELCMLMAGVVVMFLVAEYTDCKEYSGMAASIVLIMLIPGDGQKLLYALQRGVQTVTGIFLAWLINVKLLPYHGKAEPSAES